MGGNVGIGTTTPIAALAIASATDTPYVLAVYGGNGSSTAGSSVIMNTGNGGQVGLVGAPGGNFSFTTGIGGSAVSGESSGANGGDFLVTTAAGGNSTGHQAGGRGGNMTILLGNGGTGYGGGIGGSYSVTAGNGNTGTSNGAGGSINLIAGNSPGGISGNIVLTPGNNGTNATGSVIISTLAGLGSVVTLGANGALTAISSTSLSSLYVSPSHVDNLAYRYNTIPLNQSVTNISIISTTTVAQVANYGAWDGQHLWVSQFAAHSITELNENGVVMATYTFASSIEPIQLAYDGRYIWVASADTYGNLIKFDPTTGASSTTLMNPGGTGSGGIQGILWDGSKLWIGLAALNDVLRFNTITGSVEATSTGDTNVNGLAMMDIPENGGVTRYIFAACSNFIAKIKGSTMVSSLIGTPSNTYRIATDGDFLYGASYLASSTDATVEKYDARSGTKIVSWNSGTLLNTIAFDGRYIWVSGDDQTTTVHDRTSGAIVASIPNSGKSDLIFDGTYMWSISSAGFVRKLGIGEQMGNLKVAQGMSLMDENNNVGLLLLATSTGSSYMMSNFGIGTTSPTAPLTVTNSTTTGVLVSISSPNALATTGSLLSLAADGATTPTGVMTLSANGLTSGNGLSISTTNTAQTGSSLQVTTGSTGQPTNGLVFFNFAGARTTAGAAFKITDVSTTVATTTQITADALTSGAALSISAAGLTTGTGLGIFTAAATQTGPSLFVKTAGTSAPTNGLVFFNFAGARTTAGAAFQITDVSTTVATTTQITADALTSGAALSISAAGLTTGTGLGIFTAAATQTGPSLLVSTAGTSAPTNGLVFFNFAGARTTAGAAFQITDVSTTVATTTQITANALTSRLSAFQLLD